MTFCLEQNVNQSHKGAIMSGIAIEIIVGAKYGKPWAGKVIHYPEGKTPTLAFGRMTSEAEGRGAHCRATIEVSDLEAGDIIYATANEFNRKSFSQITRAIHGLSVNPIGFGTRAREVYASIALLRAEMLTHHAAWREEMIKLEVNQFTDLARAFEIISRFLQAGFYAPLDPLRLDSPGKFSERVLVTATEKLLQFLILFPEHADFLRLAANKLSEFKTVKARLVQNRIECATR
jgi:hypothetical protein